MATTYMIDFTMTIGTVRCITADNEKQALKIADALLRNRSFEADLCENLQESITYSDFSSPQVIDYDDKWLPEYDDEEWQEIYGIDMKALREED